MKKASLEHDTQVAIAACCPQDFELVAFHRVVQHFSEDTKDTKQAKQEAPS